MSGKRMALLLLLVSAVIPGPVSCASPGPSDTPVPPETPAEVLAARDAALVYLIGHYGEQAPWRNLIWLEEETAPEGLVGQVAYQYAAGDWVITVSHPTAAPETVIYSVAVANQTTGFQWEGQVDATGRVTGAPEGVVAARDVAVTFVRGHFDEAPAESLSWAEERLTPEDLPGGAEWRYVAGDWAVTVSYAVVAPEWTVYRVGVFNEATGFEWEGRVDGSGRAPEAPENALLARDQAMLYISEQYGLSGLGAGLAWQEERLTPENIVGGETYQYTAGDWVVTLSYPVVLPENTIYTITVTNEASGFEWEGEVDPQGVVTEK